MQNTMSVQDYLNLGSRGSKFGNQKVKADGYTFDSKAEHRRYCELILLLDSGAITDLTIHPKYTLLDSFKHDGKTIRGISYKPDFEYFERGHRVIEDVKGGKATQTEAFKMRVKLLLKRYPDVEFRTVTA